MSTQVSKRGPPGRNAISCVYDKSSTCILSVSRPLHASPRSALTSNSKEIAVSADNPSGEEQDGGKQPKREIILAVIEYASRPLATVFVGLFLVVWLFFMRGPLLQLLANTESVKIGSFEIQLREQAHYENLGDQLRA